MNSKSTSLVALDVLLLDQPDERSEYLVNGHILEWSTAREEFRLGAHRCRLWTPIVVSVGGLDLEDSIDRLVTGAATRLATYLGEAKSLRRGLFGSVAELTMTAGLQMRVLEALGHRCCACTHFRLGIRLFGWSRRNLWGDFGGSHSRVAWLHLRRRLAGPAAPSGV